jgi:hypothetical protein
MAITLQVVGIFFNAAIKVSPDGDTALNVLQAAQAQASAGDIPNVSQFNFTRNADTGSLSSFRAKYESEFNGRETKKAYPPGEYYLAENLNPGPSYTVWQYYIIDANGKSISGNGIVYPQNAQVPDGGKLIWRLVTILSGPTAASRAAEKALLSS